MTFRQLIIGIIIVSAFFAFIMLSLIAVIQYKPHWIGFQGEISDSLSVDDKISEEIEKLPPPVPLKYVHIEPTVEISQSELYHIESKLQKYREILIKFDSLLNTEKFLRDSLKKNAEIIVLYGDSLKRAINNINKAHDIKDLLNDSINTLNNLLNRANDRLDIAQKRIENYESLLESRVDTASQSNFITFAKIYDNSQPQEVAKILELLDERDAAKILKLMNRKQAGKVLEAMKPENAAAILLLGVGQ